MGQLDDILVLQRGFDLPTMHRVSGEYPVIAASGPSGQGRNRNHVHNLPVLLPPMELIHTFDELVMPIKKRCKIFEGEINFLVAIRDALLPKLMNGDIPVGAGSKPALLRFFIWKY